MRKIVFTCQNCGRPIPDEEIDICYHCDMKEEKEKRKQKHEQGKDKDTESS